MFYNYHAMKIKAILLSLILISLPMLIYSMELTVRAEMQDFNVNALGGGVRSFDGILGVDFSILKDLADGFYFEGSAFLVIPAGDVLPYGGLTKKFDLTNLSNVFSFNNVYGTLGLEIKMGDIGVFGEVAYNLNVPIVITNPSKISLGILFVF